MLNLASVQSKWRKRTPSSFRTSQCEQYRNPPEWPQILASHTIKEAHLTALQKRKDLLCHKYLAWDPEKWKTVLWSDETTVTENWYSEEGYWARIGKGVSKVKAFFDNKNFCSDNGYSGWQPPDSGKGAGGGDGGLTGTAILPGLIVVWK